MATKETFLGSENAFVESRELQTSGGGSINPKTSETNDNLNETDSSIFMTPHPSWMPSATPSFPPSSSPSMVLSSAPTENVYIHSNDSQIIQETFRLYGSLYLLFFLSFCIMRKHLNKYVNLRSWVTELKTDHATNAEYGYFSWAWKVFSVSDDHLLETCGMDALCFLRCLRLGTKFTLMGTINSVWLIPLYRTAESSPETDLLTDPFVLMSVANVPNDSLRFIGTVIAAYITVLTSLYLLMIEFDWYAEYRHKYLSQRKPRNYAIYVSGIPQEYRSSYGLADYFRQCSSWRGSVYEAHVTMDIPSLEAKVARRNHLVEKMEHVAALERKKGFKQTHHTIKLRTGEGMKRVDSLQTFTEELISLNSTIALEVGHITRSNHRMRQHLGKLQPSRQLKLDFDEIDDDDSSVEPRTLHKSESAPNLASGGSSTTSFSLTRGLVNTASSSRMECVSDIEEGSLLLECEPDLKDNPLYPSVNDGTKSVSVTDSSTEGSVLKQTTSILRGDLKGQSQVVHPFLGTFDLNNKLFSSLTLDDARGADSNSVGTTEIVFEDTSFEMVPVPEPPNEKNKQDSQLIGPEEEEIRFEGSAEVDRCGDMGEYSFVPDTSLAVGGVPAPCQQSHPSGTSKVDRYSMRNSSSRISYGSKKSSSSWALGDTIRSTSASVSSSVKSGVKRVGETTQHVGDQVKKASKVGVSTVKAAGSLAGSGVKKAAELGLSTLQQAPDLGKTVGASLVASAAAVVPLRFGRSEGEPLEAGFVVFRDLYTTQAARQMLQHNVPSCMLVEPAPDPEEIFWRNVGLPAQSRKTGWALSMSATSVLCLFWSIPMAFFSSLTEVNSLKEKLPNLGELTVKYPSLESFLALIAPLLLLTLNQLVLPGALKHFATWEGHVGASLLEASLFVKLCAFAIIQAFFVSALSGTITAELANFLDEPEKIVDLLATSLPAQSSYFIQICLVFTFLLQGLDLVRAYPLGLAILRRYVFGPNLTTDERKKSWGMFRSLEDPPDFWHAELLAQVMLFFVVFFVYSVIAPITSPFLLVCFLVLESGYRYHFIHNQNPTPDSGGKLWPGFVHVVIASQLIGQCTLFGLLVLKRMVYALPALLPCGLITLLFAIFIVPRRHHVANFLPTRNCAEVDKRFNEAGDHVKHFAAKSYLQPALKAQHIYPRGFEIPRMRTRTMSLEGTR